MGPGVMGCDGKCNSGKERDCQGVGHPPAGPRRGCCTPQPVGRHAAGIGNGHARAAVACAGLGAPPTLTRIGAGR